MAWLSGLAGKAEEVLNTIDKSTAKVLKKEDIGKQDLLESNLLEVRSLPPDSNLTVEEFLRNEESYLPQQDFLDKRPTFVNKMTVSAPTTPAHGERIMQLQSESLAWLDKEVKSVDNQFCDVSKNNQNIEFGSDRKDLFLSTINDSNHESKDLLVNLNGNSEEISSSLNNKDSLKTSSKEQQLQTSYVKEIESLQEKINTLSSEKTRFIREISDLTSTLEKTRFELNSVESELEQHRARALKTLQEKDKLISELRNNSGTEIDDSVLSTELNQLKQEREVLREENRQIREKLKTARQELTDAEFSAEKVRQRALEASIQARESVTNEKRRRLEAEEDAKLKSEELRSLREEMSIRNNAATLKLQKQESEISRLRSKLSAVATPSSEVESRLSSLTRTLVLKQQELEHLTTDRNALRLQLERLEHEYQNWRKTLPFNSMNDTDDAKALLPSFLMESPFDTGVTRRVKRAYSTLDAVGIRIGVFLRRYPLARIFVLIYMALLQFWIMIVLFLQSPEAH